MAGFAQNSDFTVHFTGIGSTTVPPEGVPAILVHSIPTGIFVRRGFWCVMGGAIIWAYRPNAGINFTQFNTRGCPNTFVQYDPQAQIYSDVGQQTGSGFTFQSYFEFFGSWPDTLTADTDLNLHAGNTLPPGAYRFYEGLPPGKASFYRATPSDHCLGVPAWAGRFRYVDISIEGFSPVPVTAPPPPPGVPKDDTGFGVVEFDSPRGRLHTRHGTRVKTVQSSTYADAFESPAYPVDTWKRFASVPRASGLLLLLGKVDTLYKLFASQDGGETATEIHSVTADSALIHIDSERGLWVFLYEVGAGTVMRQESVDDGVTWTDAAPANLYDADTMTTSHLAGTLRDIAGNPRNGTYALAINAKDGSALLASTEAGKTWIKVLS